MEKAIGILLPDEIKEKAVVFCTEYDPKLTEPYMILADPETLKNIKGVDRKLQSFCISQPPFKTIVGGPNIERSESGMSLYLTVIMGSLNAVRDKLVKHLKVPPGEFFRAQLVLIEERPESDYNFDAMLESAKEIFAKPQEFSAMALAIYSRESSDQPFKMENSYPLTGR